MNKKKLQDFSPSLVMFHLIFNNANYPFHFRSPLLTESRLIFFLSYLDVSIRFYI